MTSEIYEVVRLGHRGDGVIEGPIYAPRVLPGERVRGTRVGDQLTDIRIETPSDDRVAPPCRHYKSCGGCHLQHARDGFVAAWKQEIVRTALAAHGIVCDMRPVMTSPPRSRRRAGFAARRTKGGALAGFHQRGSDTIIDITECQLIRPELDVVPEMLRALCRVGATRKAALTAQCTVTEDGLDVVVSGGRPLDADLRAALPEILAPYPVARLTWEDEPTLQSAVTMIGLGRARVPFPPGAFLQATAEGEAALVAGVRAAVGTARHVADLFAGCGTFALPLAEQAAVHAVEGARSLTDALEAGARMAQGLKPVTTETRDLFRNPLLAAELARFDAAVLDPPRAGARAQTAEIARSELPDLAYVSCDPQSFARDAAALVSAGFTLCWVQVIDQFRWSPHVELVSHFHRG